MIYDAMPLDELVRSLIDKKIQMHKTYERGDNELADELSEATGEFGRAIVARGNEGANALRPLLDDPREIVQLLGAAWLIDLDPGAAAPTLYRLEREAVDPVVGSSAQLSLMSARHSGILPPHFDIASNS